MFSSYKFSQEVNFQSILWAGIGAVAAFFRCLNAADRAATATGKALAASVWPAMRRAGAWIVASGLLWAILATLRLAPVIVAIAGAVVGVFAVIAMIPLVFWPCLAGIAPGAWLTYPRSKAVQA